MDRTRTLTSAARVMAIAVATSLACTAGVAGAQYPGCGMADECCDEPVGCGDCVTFDSCCACPSPAGLYAGFEATMVKPRFGDNVAFTVMQADGASFESFTDTEFDYDLEFAPRVYVGWKYDDGIGLRASWWQFDHAAAAATASPPANGFGEITHPAFGDVDISTSIPSDTFAAAADLNVYAIDLEFTKETQFAAWRIGMACGIRYASAEQSYLAQLRDSGDDLQGEIDFRHRIEGFGPTISLISALPVTESIDLFAMGRGSALFGDATSRLVAGEDLDLTTPFTTTRTTSRDDLFSIGEIQIGLRWNAARRRGRTLLPFVSIAMEGQLWNNVGNAASEDGDLGFFGLSSGAGFMW